jgi:sirohydrochlorin ferrochelatase
MIRRRAGLLPLALLLLAASPALAQTVSPQGILILAHGGQPDWNARVTELAAALGASQPVEVAFGMASRPAIQAAVDRLIARGVRSIVAVPLFVSSHSSVVTSTAYLLGLRADMPPDLKVFAKMNHGAHGAPAAPAASHSGHEGHAPAAADNTAPVSASVPIRMTDALNRHALVGSILIDRARGLSQRPGQGAVIIVAHGPVPDADNARWLADMKALAGQMAADTRFAAIEYLTVRDDAPKPVRDAATAELRGVVTAQRDAGRRVLIVPLLLSYGGIEKGIRQRLDGLDYVMAPTALMPDPRLVEWVRQSVRP